MKKLIQQGAEAKIYLVNASEIVLPNEKVPSTLTKSSAKHREELRCEADKSCEQSEQQFIIKDRIPKAYRLKELDDKIRKQRTKSETKLLLKASKIINAPIPEETKDSYKIIIPFIEEEKLAEHLDNFELKEQLEICKKIGESVSKLHKEGLIHGDLTTSNMIYVREEKDFDLTKSSERSEPVGGREGQSKSDPKSFKVFFIDFGLGYQNGKYEDKAVDLHVLKQALEAKHFTHWEKLWKAVESGYLKIQPAESKKVLERLTAVEKRGRYKH